MGGNLISKGLQKVLAVCSLLTYCNNVKGEKNTFVSMRGPWAHVELVKNSRETFDGNIVFVIVNPERSKLRPCLLGPIKIREKKVPVISYCELFTSIIPLSWMAPLCHWRRLTFPRPIELCMAGHSWPLLPQFMWLPNASLVPFSSLSTWLLYSSWTDLLYFPWATTHLSDNSYQISLPQGSIPWPLGLFWGLLVIYAYATLPSFITLNVTTLK